MKVIDGVVGKSTGEYLTGDPLKWDELDTEQELTVLRWVEESIHMGMKKQIQTRAYAGFVKALNSDPTTPEAKFCMKKIWERLPENTRAHFGHAYDILFEIQEQIDTLEDRLENDLEESDTEESNEAEPLEVKEVPRDTYQDAPTLEE